MSFDNQAYRPTAWRVMPFGIVALGIAIFDVGWHEFWRDEAGAMMAMRAVPWSGLLEAMRYEGVPPLFHALLKLAGQTLPNALALVAIGVLGLSTLMFGTYRLIASVSGSPVAARRLTLALSFTYTYAYELGVMIRQYTLGLGLALLSFAYLREALRTGARRATWLGAIAAGLSALTSAHSACVAGAGLLAFGLVSVARKRSLRGIWPLLLTLPCFALVVYIASPFPGRTYEANVVLHFPPAIGARLSLQALVEGVMPADWWFVASFVPRRFEIAAAMLQSTAFWGFFMCVVATIAARRTSPVRTRGLGAFDVLAVTASFPPLLVIFIQHYWGSYRHHLFLGAPLVVLVVGHAARVGNRSRLVLLAPLFVFQVALAAGSFVLDARYPFSDTKAAARVLPEAAHVVADADWRSAGMLFWRPDIQMRSASWQGQPFRYIRPDNNWHRVASLLPIVEEECQIEADRVYFAGTPTSLGSLALCGTRIEYPTTPFTDHPFTWESFELYRIDCACVAQARRAK